MVATTNVRATQPPSPPRLISIGELSRRTGIPTTTLRYYDDLGLLPPATRITGRRHYTDTSARYAALVTYFKGIGFTLQEIKAFLQGAKAERLTLIERKVAELVEQQHRIQRALDALGHEKVCPAEDHLRCTRFWAIIDGGLPQNTPVPLPEAADHLTQHNRRR